MPIRKNLTASDYLLQLKHMDSKTEDALTRFYLRLLKSGSWSYQLRKENLLLTKQSQEAYRKKLNKFTVQGFIGKGKKYYIEGKPRIPFESNPHVIEALINRYSIIPLESKAAMQKFNELRKQKNWIKTIDEKLESKERLKFLNTIFPMVFMGHEISKFFFKLLFISVTRSTPEFKENDQYQRMHGMLLEIFNKIQLSIAHEGADYVGKRIFLDLYVKEVMTLLYASGAQEKHWDTMKIAILEDVTIPLLTPVNFTNISENEINEFNQLSPGERFKQIIDHIKSSEEHYVKEYYGENWEQGLSAYIYYALTTSLERPGKEIQDFIQILTRDYHVSQKIIKSVEDEIQSKLEKHKNEKATLLF